jgi:DNA-binding MarR family transcriptional regulator
MARGAVDPTEAAVELAIAMTRLRSRLRQESQQQSQEWSMHHLAVLRRVLDGGTTTAGALAAAEHVRPQSMTDTVAALRSAGLLSASADPSDRRRTLLTVSSAGQALLESVVTTREEWLAGVIATELTAAERQLLIRATEVLNRLAEVDGAPS